MIWDSADDLLPGLLPASFRGVGFFVPDARTEAGRRVVEYLFPGVDPAAYDDFGVLPQSITLDGMMVGDDYVAQAAALAAAFEQPGPGTLVHPWFGAMTVMVLEPGEVSFYAAELRVARFHAVFRRPSTGIAGGLDGGIASTAASALPAAVTAIAGAIAETCAAVDTLTASRVRATATTRSDRIARAAWLDDAAGTAAAEIYRAAVPASSPQAYAVILAAVVEAVTAAVVEGVRSPAVAPAAGYVRPLSLDPDAAAGIGHAVATRLAEAAEVAPSAPDRALLVAGAAAALQAAGSATIYRTFEAREEATAARQAFAAAAAAIATACDPLAETRFAAQATALRRAMRELAVAHAREINEVVGRLPPVMTLAAERPADAFQVANHIAGDRPATIEAAYLDLVRRNRPRHPSQLGPGRIEAAR